MGSVGQDKNSQILEEKAREDGVNVQYQYNENEPTGSVLYLWKGKNIFVECLNYLATKYG